MVFCKFRLKNNLTDVLSPFYESDMCYSAEVLFKTAKKGQKPYLYHSSIDMVSVKMNKISKTISILLWYRYGFLEVFLKKTT